MILSPKELRSICQKPKYRTVGNWMARFIVRDLAIYGTWLVLHTPMRADSIALISLLCGFASAFLLAIPTAAALFAGAFMLQVWYFLDHVDGQVARYYKEADLTGTFFDFMIHFFVHSAVVFGLGMRMFFQTGSVLWLILGFFSALAMGGLSQFHDCKYKVFFSSGLAPWEGKIVRLGVTSEPEVGVAGGEGTIPPIAGFASKKAFIFLYKLTETHVFMNLLGLFAILELTKIGSWPWASKFVWSYAVLLPGVLTARMIYTIRTHRIDAEFARRFSLVSQL